MKLTLSPPEVSEVLCRYATDKLGIASNVVEYDSETGEVVLTFDEDVAREHEEVRSRLEREREAALLAARRKKWGRFAWPWFEREKGVALAPPTPAADAVTREFVQQGGIGGGTPVVVEVPTAVEEAAGRLREFGAAFAGGRRAAA